MFNRKRQVRECTNQVVEYDCNSLTINILKTKGVSIGVRKNHSAVIYKGSMVVYGGQSENGMMSQDMIVFHLDTHEWVKIGFKQGPFTQQPFIQGGMVSVVGIKANSNSKHEIKTRKVSSKLD